MTVANNSAISAVNTTSRDPKPHNVNHQRVRQRQRDRQHQRDLQRQQAQKRRQRWRERWIAIKLLQKKRFSLTHRRSRFNISTPTMTPIHYWQPVFVTLPPMTSNDDRVMHFDGILPDLKDDFQRVPEEYSVYRNRVVVNVFAGALAGVVALIILATVLSARDKRKRRGARAEVGAEVVQPDKMTTAGPFGLDSGPHNNDLPPSYSECAPSSIFHFTSEKPPTYDADLHEYEQQQNAFIENERRADVVAITTRANDADDVTPGMRTELVFNNGRVVERLSLDLSGTNTTGEAGDGNVQEHNTRHIDIENSVVYIDETPKEVIVGISYDI